MSSHESPKDPKRPSLPTRVGRGLSFMNKLAFILLVLGLLALALKHH